MNSKLKIKGFTLIELLVVISIIGLLSSVVLASLNDARAKSRDAKRKIELKQIQFALELFYNTYGYYPVRKASNTCGGGRPDWATSYCSANNWLTDDPNFLQFISKVPRDPSNQAWVSYVDLADGITKTGDDTPWWFALTYTYGTPSDLNTYVPDPKPQTYDLLTNLENKKDSERCELKVWKGVAVWNDSGCWSTASPGNVPDRAKQIWSVK